MKKNAFFLKNEYLKDKETDIRLPYGEKHAHRTIRKALPGKNHTGKAPAIFWRKSPAKIHTGN
jgi:hypothetical protein